MHTQTNIVIWFVEWLIKKECIKMCVRKWHYQPYVINWSEENNGIIQKHAMIETIICVYNTFTSIKGTFTNANLIDLCQSFEVSFYNPNILSNWPSLMNWKGQVSSFSKRNELFSKSYTFICSIPEIHHENKGIFAVVRPRDGNDLMKSKRFGHINQKSRNVLKFVQRKN